MPKPRRPVKKRKLPPEQSSDIILRALKQAGLAEHAHRLHIYQCWNQVVGPRIAARTMPDLFRGGVLFVKVANPTWQQELSYLKADILTKLNKALGRSLIHELKVICGARMGPQTPKPQELKRTPQPEPHDYDSASAASAAIACPKVRAAFESLMAKDLWLKRQSHSPRAPHRR